MVVQRAAQEQYGLPQSMQREAWSALSPLVKSPWISP
jgi:hypothetical protein